MPTAKTPSDNDFTVFVLGPDSVSRDRAVLSLAYRGFCLRLFADRAEFEAARANEHYGCALVEGVPAAEGLDFLAPSADGVTRGWGMPVVLAPDQAAGNDLQFVRRAFLAGAVDVLPAGFAPDELFAAVARAQQVAAARWSHAPSGGQPQEATDLTRRELEIARMVRQGFDNRAIGQRLGISHRTVEIHKTRLMRKLGVRSLSGLMSHPIPEASRRRAVDPYRRTALK